MEWRSIPGLEGSYEASDTGLIRSLDRWRKISPRNGENYDRFFRGRILKPAPSPSGHLHVVLEGGATRTVHSLVLEAFKGSCPAGLMARHADDDPANNRIENLSWGTRSENSHDAVRNGKHWQVNKTHCIHGHPLDAAYVNSRGHRICRECNRRRNAEYVRRKAGE